METAPAAPSSAASAWHKQGEGIAQSVSLATEHLKTRLCFRGKGGAPPQQQPLDHYDLS